MKVSEISAPQVHDLLQIDAHALTADSVSQPQWVTEALICCPWVVVRRGQAPAGKISVGVRGAARSERWAGCCSKTLIKEIVRPAELLVPRWTSAHLRRTPALQALQKVIERWQGLSLPWGPTGSVGFELATGRPVTTEGSDLDLVVHTTDRLAAHHARSLWDSVTSLQVKVDVRVETPHCGFSLEEYARASTARILLRYPKGLRLGDDPWGDDSWPARTLEQSILHASSTEAVAS
jgi:phosphoribosyl-dephospho-CoA transferase